MIRIYITNQKAKESLHLLGVQINNIFPFFRHEY